MSKRFTEGICGDSAAILDNGKMITITEILENLNKAEQWKEKTKNLLIGLEAQYIDKFMNEAKIHDYLGYGKAYIAEVRKIMNILNNQKL